MKVVSFSLLQKEEYMSEESLIYRLRKRAEIRRSINSRKSVQEGKPDRISDLLEEAANEIERLDNILVYPEYRSSSDNNDN
jgi:hypothetical protein